MPDLDPRFRTYRPETDTVAPRQFTSQMDLDPDAVQYAWNKIRDAIAVPLSASEASVPVALHLVERAYQQIPGATLGLDAPHGTFQSRFADAYAHRGEGLRALGDDPANLLFFVPGTAPARIAKGAASGLAAAEAGAKAADAIADVAPKLSEYNQVADAARQTQNDAARQLWKSSRELQKRTSGIPSTPRETQQWMEQTRPMVQEWENGIDDLDARLARDQDAYYRGDLGGIGGIDYESDQNLRARLAQQLGNYRQAALAARDAKLQGDKWREAARTQTAMNHQRMNLVDRAFQAQDAAQSARDAYRDLPLLERASASLAEAQPGLGASMQRYLQLYPTDADRLRYVPFAVVPASNSR